MPDEPIDFIKAKENKWVKNNVNPSLIVKDENGIAFYCFSIEYRHEDSTYCFDIWAKNQVDAEKRLLAIQGTGILVGQKCDIFS